MTTAAEFWKSVRPSGLTGEEELIAFWQRMLDCPCKDTDQPIGGGTRIMPRRLPVDAWRAKLMEEDELILYIITHAIADGIIH